MNTELVSFPMHDVTAHGILDEKNRDTLHVQWILTQACNGRCSYCTQWSEMGNTVYVKERVLEIAYKILADRRTYYAFTFTGGEPTLHPHLTDILAYLYRSHTPLGVVVETNGLRNLDYYKELVEIAPKHTLRLTISAHLEKIALKDLCFLIAMTAEHKQHAHVRLILDPNQRKKVRVFYDTLMKLRAVTPFTLDLWLLTRTENPLELDGRYTETDFSWYEDAQKRFDEITTTSPLSLPPLLPPVIPQFCYLTETKDVAWCDQEDTDLELEFKDFYCCLGTNFLRVSSDGTFQGALCCQARPQQPLWKETSHTSQTLKILQCASSCCVEERNAVLPKFRQKREAEDWVRDFEERRTAQKWEAAPLPHPVHPEPSLEDKVRIRLKRMQPENVSSPQGTPQPETIRQRFTDICTIYAALADEDSKEIFLRRIKFLETGDAGYTLLSAYSAGEHPEMPIYPEDEAFLETGTGYFRLLHLGGTTDNLALLTEQEKRIAYYQPKMRIALTAPEWCLDIPLHILEKYKGYTLLIGQHGTEANETWLYAIPPVLPKRYPVIPEELADKLPLVSVIVPTHNNEDTLKRCLDSALIQGIERMELIIIDDASTDKTPEIIAEYVRRYPKIVRTLRFAENKGPGPARNAGMDMAYGQYMTFIDSDDMLAEDFLKRGLEVMEKEDADIVAFDMVMNRDGEEVLWGVEPGTWAGEASLYQYLLKKIGCYASYCCLYKTYMLRQYNIEYADTIIREDMFFCVRAFYYSSSTVVIPYVGYYRYFRKGSITSINHGHKNAIAFIKFIGFLARFFYTHNLNMDNKAYIYCVQKVYSWDRWWFFKYIIEEKNKGNIKNLLTNENLLELSSSKEIIRCILADYSILYCYRKKLNPTVDIKDIDWESAAIAPHQPKTYVAYKNADYPQEKKPLISIIVPNYNKAQYLQRCLDSILSQSMQNFELIIIDDASTDGSLEILQDYAEIYPCIRLYKMNYNNRQGICRNIGIEKSLGNYIIFIDSDDYIESNYFSIAIDFVTNKDIDIALFSWRSLNENNNIVYQYSEEEFELEGKFAYIYYIEDKIVGGPWAKIINKNIIIENNIRFSEYVFHQDHPFISKCLINSKKVIYKDILVYNVCETKNSSIRPNTKKYINIHSSYVFFRYYQDEINLLDSNIYRYERIKHFDWHFKNIFLSSCAAFYNTIGTIPLTEEDHQLIKPCTFFIYELLIGYAFCREQGTIPEGILFEPFQPYHKKFLPIASPSPLISIITVVYNIENSIEKYLERILTQSLRNLELIIINNGSIDNTLDLCLSWQQKDPRILIINNEKNIGYHDCLNKGFEKSHGKYIINIDSYNYILSNFLLHGLSILENNNEIDVLSYIHDKCNKYSIKEERNTQDTKGILPINNIKNSYIDSINIYKKTLLVNNLLKYDILFNDLFIFYYLFYAKKIFFEDIQEHIDFEINSKTTILDILNINKNYITDFFVLAKAIYIFSKKYPSKNDSLSYKEKTKYIFEKFKKIIPDIILFNNLTFLFKNKDIENLVSAPDFFRMILNDYANIYSKNINFKPLSHLQYFGLETNRFETKKEIINIPFYFDKKNIFSMTIAVFVNDNSKNISHCLESILDQGLKDIEIIIIENCLTDINIITICKKYSEKYKNISLFYTLINIENNIMIKFALQQAKGLYILFLYGNDFIAPNFLLRAYSLIQKNTSFDIINFSYYDLDNEKRIPLKFNRMPNGLQVKKDSTMKFFINNLDICCNLWTKIYSVSFLNRNESLFENDLITDDLLLFELYSKASDIVFYDITSYYHTIKDDNQNQNYSKNELEYIFNCSLKNISKAFTLLEISIEEKSYLNKYRKKIENHLLNKYKHNILCYIYTCNLYNLPSPLTLETLELLSNSKNGIRYFIMNYIELYKSITNNQGESTNELHK